MAVCQGYNNPHDMMVPYQLGVAANQSMVQVNDFDASRREICILPSQFVLSTSPGNSPQHQTQRASPMATMSEGRHPKLYARHSKQWKSPPPPVKEKEMTTFMMRNLPNKYTQHMLLQELSAHDFRLKVEIDFFYLPMDHNNAVNLGYCFINFVNNRVAKLFSVTFSGKRLARFKSTKTVVVMPASIQGYERNFQYYASTRVAQAEDPQYRPIFGRQDPSPVSSPVAKAVQKEENQHELDTCAGSTLKEEVARIDPPSRHTPEVSPLQDSVDVIRANCLYIRNTFLGVGPERSPSVERFIEERQVRSCPVSLSQSEAGSGRMQDHSDLRPNALGQAMQQVGVKLEGFSKGFGGNVSSTSSLKSRGTSGRETMVSSHDSAVPTKSQGAGSSSGSGDLPTETTISEFDGPALPTLGTVDYPCKGSILHHCGSCKPCAFYKLAGDKGGCKNQVDCEFCHLCDPGEKKRRRKERQVKKKGKGNALQDLRRESC